VGFSIAEHLARLTGLTALALPGCLCLTGRLAVLSPLQRLGRLQALDMSGCVFLGDAGVARVAALCAPRSTQRRSRRRLRRRGRAPAGLPDRAAYGMRAAAACAPVCTPAYAPPAPAAPLAGRAGASRHLSRAQAAA
jgi:hypothetical protein